MDNRKYELTEETKSIYGIILHRIKALGDFGDVKAGDFGGWVESEKNLSHYGNCWIYDNAKVFDNAIVYGDAEVYRDAKVFGNAKVYDNAKIFDNAKVYRDAIVYRNAQVLGNAKVYGTAIIKKNAEIKTCKDYVVVGTLGSRDGYTTFYLDKNRNIWVNCGCFSDTIEKFEEAVNEKHQNSKYGAEYLNVIDFAKKHFEIWKK